MAFEKLFEVSPKFLDIRLSIKGTAKTPVFMGYLSIELSIKLHDFIP